MTRVRIGLLAVAVVVAVAVPAAAWEGSAEVSLQSRYLWRGMALTDRPVLQPSMTLSRDGLEASVWASLDLTAAEGRRFQYTEIDYSAAYTLGLDGAEVTLTGYRYTYADVESPPTTEAWVTVAPDLPFAPTVTVVRDLEAAHGTYYLLTFSHPLGPGEGEPLDGPVVGLSLGHGDSDYARAYFPDSGLGGVTDYGVRLDWSFAVGRAELGLGLQYAAFTSARVRAEGLPRAAFAAGVTCSLPFEL